MIKVQTQRSFAKSMLKNSPAVRPLIGQIELTYRCNLDCVHCYCKGSEKGAELTAKEWKSILDQLHSCGVIWLTLTGGEPLIREDFFDIYSYAKAKGFVVTIFTNGISLDEEAINYLVRYPPHSIEISLYGIDEETYESVSRRAGSYKRLMHSIDMAVSKGLALVLKTVGLLQNKHQIHKIKSFTDELLGKNKFKFDSIITPRLNGDKTPSLYRLSAGDILDIEERCPDMASQRNKEFLRHRALMRDAEYKYHCNIWFKNFYITPYGRLRFCPMTDKYSYDLKERPFKEGFYERVPKILEERYGNKARCVICELREFCLNCPARAYLETGNEDSAVDYLCELAKMTKDRIEKVKNRTLTFKGVPAVIASPRRGRGNRGRNVRGGAVSIRGTANPKREIACPPT